jgi:hypothetical protein
MELTVKIVDYAPTDLYEQVPFTIKVLRLVPGQDRPDYYLGELTEPLFWNNDGRRVGITHVVISARSVGARIALGVRDLGISIAYVLDPTQITDAFLDFAKCRYVAIGLADENTGENLSSL